jgi:site-specific recombinase XerD
MQNKCPWCRGKFGLVRYYHFRIGFCRNVCRAKYQASWERKKLLRRLIPHRAAIPASSARHRRSLSTRQYARLVHRWVESIGLESAYYGTHSMRRTKATQIYRRTSNLRAVQLLLGHSKLESTVRYLGVEVDDALNIAEQIEL